MRRNEKMKMKKVMAAMLAGMMLVSMAGCGTGAQEVLTVQVQTVHRHRKYRWKINTDDLGQWF